MTRKNFTWAAASLIMLATLSGCAKTVYEGSNSASKRYLDAWITVHYPGLAQQGLGYYSIPEFEITGTGAPVADSAFVFANYTQYDLDGNILTTTLESKARQLGTYSQKSYYGQVVLQKSAIYAGLLSAIDDLNVGASRKVIIPNWLCSYDTYDTPEEYLEVASSSDHTVYEFTITDATNNINRWQIDTLERYVATNMESVDSVRYGQYYKVWEEADVEEDFEMPTDTTVYINYTGRLLNGQVFDTTIKDTAKVYGLYSSSKTYEPVEISFAESYDEITMDSSSVIDGFAYAISLMKPYEKITTAFYSNFGYSYSGSSPSIPAYAPLVFEIQMVDNPE